jgi:hypothetical protein
VPGSMRNVALMFGGERAWKSWGELLHSVRTGESGTRRVYGVGTFEYLADNPEQAAIFNAAMSENTRRITELLIRPTISPNSGTSSMSAAATAP